MKVNWIQEKIIVIKKRLATYVNINFLFIKLFYINKQYFIVLLF